jgi:hypothetical protein
MFNPNGEIALCNRSPTKADLLRRNGDAATAGRKDQPNSSAKLRQPAEQGDQPGLTARLRFCENRRQLGPRRAYFDSQPRCDLCEAIAARNTLRQAHFGVRQMENAFQHVLTGNGNLIEIRKSQDGSMMTPIGFANFERDQLPLAIARDENGRDVVFEAVVDVFEKAATGGLRDAIQKAVHSRSRAEHAALELHHLAFFGTCTRNLLERYCFYLPSCTVFDPHSPSQIGFSSGRCFFLSVFHGPRRV